MGRKNRGRERGTSSSRGKEWRREMGMKGERKGEEEGEV